MLAAFGRVSKIGPLIKVVPAPVSISIATGSPFTCACVYKFGAANEGVCKPVNRGSAERSRGPNDAKSTDATAKADTSREPCGCFAHNAQAARAPYA